MPEGKIKKLVSDRGFGFVEGNPNDLFFHHSEVQGVAFEELQEGQLVEYEVGEGRKGPCATAIRSAEGDRMIDGQAATLKKQQPTRPSNSRGAFFYSRLQGKLWKNHLGLLQIKVLRSAGYP